MRAAHQRQALSDFFSFFSFFSSFFSLHHRSRRDRALPQHGLVDPAHAVGPGGSTGPYLLLPPVRPRDGVDDLQPPLAPRRQRVEVRLQQDVLLVAVGVDQAQALGVVPALGLVPGDAVDGGAEHGVARGDPCARGDKGHRARDDPLAVHRADAVPLVDKVPHGPFHVDGVADGQRVEPAGHHPPAELVVVDLDHQLEFSTVGVGRDGRVGLA